MAAGRPRGASRSAASSAAGSIANPPGPMSTSTGFAPALSIPATLATAGREHVIERDPRTPAGQLAKPAVARDKVADVDALAFLRKLAPLEMSAAVGADQRLCESQQ